MRVNEPLPNEPQSPPSSPATSSFAFNRPTIIALLYLASPLLWVTALVGVVLAYVWRNEPHQPWEDSHYSYLIRTFWLFFIASVIGMFLIFTLILSPIGFLLMFAVLILALVRSVLVLVNAQKTIAMPNPETWLA
jgi:uncharacterized membrane protein